MNKTVHWQLSCKRFKIKKKESKWPHFLGLSMVKTAGCNRHLFCMVIQEALMSSCVTNDTSFHPMQTHVNTQTKAHTFVWVGGSDFQAVFLLGMCIGMTEKVKSYRGGSSEYRPRKEVKNDVGDIWKISKQISPCFMVGRNETICLAWEKGTENLKDAQVHHLFLLLAQTILRPWSITNAFPQKSNELICWQQCSIVRYCSATRHDTEIPIPQLNMIHTTAFVASHEGRRESSQRRDFGAEDEMQRRTRCIGWT